MLLLSTPIGRPLMGLHRGLVGTLAGLLAMLATPTMSESQLAEDGSCQTEGSVASGSFTQRRNTEWSEGGWHVGDGGLAFSLICHRGRLEFWKSTSGWTDALTEYRSVNPIGAVISSGRVKMIVFRDLVAAGTLDRRTEFPGDVRVVTFAGDQVQWTWFDEFGAQLGLETERGRVHTVSGPYRAFFTAAQGGGRE